VEILRNLWRRKLRTILTITGIVMGIFALTTMGSMAEHFNALLDGGVTYFSSTIRVADDKSSSFGPGGFLTLDKLAEIGRVDGVAHVSPSMAVVANPGELATVSFNIPDEIANWDPGAVPYLKFKFHLAAGRWVTDASRGEVVLGTSFASDFNARVGDTIYLPKRPSDAKPDFVNHAFRVVGVLQPTLTLPDSVGYVSLHDAQMLIGDNLPAAERTALNPYQLSQGAGAYGRPGANLDQLAERITNDVNGVKATRPSVIVASFKSSGAIFTFITTAAALLAIVIGGLSVVNTMIMSVTERVREIGLKKAIGAKTVHIMREFVAEATVIGLIGGVLGYLAGLALTTVLNASQKGGGLFLITPRLTLLCLVFAVILGAGAGLLPAIRAARMDPVAALRAQ